MAEVWLKNFVALDSIKSLLCILICLGKCHVMVLGNSFAGRRRLLESGNYSYMFHAP